MSVADLIMITIGVLVAVALVYEGGVIVKDVAAWIRSRCGTDTPETPPGVETTRYLMPWPSQLEDEIRRRVAISGDSEAFIGTDAHGDPFIAHGAWMPEHPDPDRDRFEVWIFDASDDQVSLLDIAFPVTGFFTADMEPIS